MESTLFDGKILFLKPSSTLFNILRLAALLQVLAYFSIIMPRLTSNSMSLSLRMLYLSCVKMREIHCPVKSEQKLALGG